MRKAIFCTLLGLLLWGCANRGIGPQGGPKDTTPPKPLKSTPENGSLNFHGKTVKIRFNEYIQLENPVENVVISPPQQHPAEISGIGKSVHIKFPDPLKDSTTYTIDFGSAIKDNNEKNPLDNYSFSFSTCSYMDSLEIHGTVIDAETLNPLQGIVTGIHADHADSAFEKTPFTRIGISGSNGEFAIRNIKEGTYRLYALQDGSRDFIYQPGESFAMGDSLITPHIDIETRYDTIWRDTTAGDSTMHIPDSVITSEYHYYEPGNLLLRLFKEDKRQHYLDRVIRKEPHRIQFIFSAPAPQVPQIRIFRPANDSIENDSINTEPYIRQLNRQQDTITCWLTDSLYIRTDSLQAEVIYLKSDSLYNLQEQTDTLLAVYRQTTAAKNAAKKQENDTIPPKREPLNITCNAKQDFEIYDSLRLYTQCPLLHINSERLHLSVQEDTLWKDIPFQTVTEDPAQMNYLILFNMQEKHTYRLTADSAAMTDIYGHDNDSTTWSLTCKSTEDYSTLLLHIADWEPNIIVQLLDEKDQPLQQYQALTPDMKIEHLTPSIYYLRLYIDQNGDGKWTTGDWIQKRQPEPVYYFPKKMNLRANWDFEETFQWKSVPLLEQKPSDLKKNDANKK